MTARVDVKKRTRDLVLHRQQCLDALQEMNGGTVKEVAAVVGKDYDTVKKWMHDLHKARSIYVHKFVRRPSGAGKPIRWFRVGNRPDMTMEMANGRAKEEREDVERARRRHEAWKKTWVPHCDVAAQWMMGR